MKSSNSQFVLAFSLLACAGVTAMAQERAVRMKDLPPAVRATVQEQSKGARVRGLSRETQNGKTIYEAELFVSGHNKDLLIDAGGKVFEVEEQIALSALPPVVKAELLKQAGKGRILIVEAVSKGDALEFYEARVRSGLKLREVKISPAGQLLPK